MKKGKRRNRRQWIVIVVIGIVVSVAGGSITKKNTWKKPEELLVEYMDHNMAVEILAYDEGQMSVTYQTSFDTIAGNISFENKALFLKGKGGYRLVCCLYGRKRRRTSDTAHQYGRRCERKRRKRICCGERQRGSGSVV